MEPNVYTVSIYPIELSNSTSLSVQPPEAQGGHLHLPKQFGIESQSHSATDRGENCVNMREDDRTLNETLQCRVTEGQK